MTAQHDDQCVRAIGCYSRILIDTTAHLGNSKTNNKIANNSSFGDRTHHSDGRQNVFREHKRDKILIFRWLSDDKNDTVNVIHLSKESVRSQS